jgi:hypothetical protein
MAISLSSSISASIMMVKQLGLNVREDLHFGK